MPDKKAAEGTARVSAGIIALLALCVLAAAWFPLASINALPSKSYNEGWNAYRQWMTVEGLPLYGHPAALWTTNYPFLSFHLIGLLGQTKGEMVLAGRLVCFAALVAVCLFAGGILRAVTGSRRGAVYVALWLFAALGAFNGAGRAVDDPEMLGLAFASSGLFAYIYAPRRMAWVALAASGFALSLFTKHDLFAFPASVGLHLLLTRNWRGVAVALAAGAAVSALLLALSYHFDGPYFLPMLLQPRAYGRGNLLAETSHYLLHFLPALLVGMAGLWRGPAHPWRGFFRILLLLTNLTAIGFSGGDGVGANIFYAPLVADALSAAMAICWLRGQGRGFRAAIIITTVSCAVMVPFQLANDIAAQRHLAGETQADRQAIALLRAAPGPAICEDLLLCYLAGKPMVYDPYYVKDQILIGRVAEAGIGAALTRHQYGIIQISARSLAARPQSGRFTPAFLHVLGAWYQPVLVTRGFSIFVPRGPGRLATLAEN